MEKERFAVATSASAAAAEALRSAHDQPLRARALARQVLEDPDVDTDAATTSIAQEALGLAAKELNEPDEALTFSRAAVDTAERAALTERAAEARVSLAFVLQYVGQPQQALAEVDAATPYLRGSGAAQVQMRLGSVLQRLGRLDEALEVYEAALPGLRGAGGRVLKARLLSNRGVILTLQGAFAAAERDLLHAAELHDRCRQRLAAAQTRHNLGFLAARRGDVPTALSWFDRAADFYRSQGEVDWVGLIDRCELLLSTRLLDEACRLGELAVQALETSGAASDLAEARLTLANAALLRGEVDRARALAETAHEELTAQQRPRWAVLAQYAMLRASWLGGDRSVEVYELATATAAALADAGWALPSLDARLIAGRIALERCDMPAAERLLSQTARARIHGPVELRARAWHAEALLRLARGNRSGADAALRAGMRALDRHRATLGSTELRTHVAGYAGELAVLGLRLACEARDAVRVLRWAERWRAGALQLRPARPPENRELTDALNQLRSTVAELDRAAFQGRDTRALVRQQAQHEAVVQRLSRRAHGLGGTNQVLSPGALVEALEQRALVELVNLDGELLAVVVAGGKTRLRRIGPRAPVLAELGAVAFSLRQLARPSTSDRGRAAARVAAVHASELLDSLLLDPVRDLIGDRPLVIVPTGPLHALPWSLLPSCRGRSVVVAPSAQLWLMARDRREPFLPKNPDVVLVGSAELPHARAEVKALHSRYPGSRLLAGRDATVSKVTKALDGADLAHLACHAQFRADNPLFSCLRLADGPLTVYDLEGLRDAPRVLVLSACDSGLSEVKPGDELMGLSSALFASGSATLIASVVPVPDAGTRSFMLSLHSRLREGDPPGLALANASRAGSDEVATAAAAFVCFGAG